MIKKFNKEFPSFVKQEMIEISNNQPLDESMLQAYERKDEARYKAMEKTCVDKERVREVIERILDSYQFNIPVCGIISLEDAKEILDKFKGKGITEVRGITIKRIKEE